MPEGGRDGGFLEQARRPGRGFVLRETAGCIRDHWSVLAFHSEHGCWLSASLNPLPAAIIPQAHEAESKKQGAGRWCGILASYFLPP